MLESKNNQAYRVAVYCRVASTSPEDSGAIEAQRNLLRKFAAYKGFKEFKQYLDNGYAGNTLDRPAFARMTADINAGEIDTVIIKSIDRIARNYVLADQWLKGLTARDTRFIAMDGSHETVSLISQSILDLMRTKRSKRTC